MNSACIGLGYGDEGKGVVTDFLASNLMFPYKHYNPVVVRYSGGHQAGHTVTVNGLRHVFSSFGSGTLRNAPTYWAKPCTVSPLGLMNEYKVLESKGITPKLYINRDCPVTTPYDMQRNQKCFSTRAHGTCGVGFGATLQREEDHYQLHYIDLFYPQVLKNKLEMIRDYYSEKKGFDESNINPVEFFEQCEFATDTFHATTDDFLEGREVIFEGSQGLMLDKDIGFFPHVTRSNVGYRRLKALGFDTMHPTYYLVTRAYQTRHGNGPMTNMEYNLKISHPEETNVHNAWQGKFKTAVLDLDMIEYALVKDGHGRINSVLCITCLEHIIDNAYSFTYDGILFEFDSEKDFVTAVKETLKFKNVMCFRLKDGNSVVNYL